MATRTSPSKVQRTLNLDPLDSQWLIREAKRRNVSVNTVARDLFAFHRTSFGLPHLLLDALKADATAKKRTLEQCAADVLVEHAVGLLRTQQRNRK